MHFNCMNNTSSKARKAAFGILPCFVFCSLLVGACRNDMEKVRFFDKKELPQQSIDSVRVVRSESGNKQMVMTAPIVTVFDKPERKTVYPKGVKMQIFDGGNKIIAEIKAGYAVSLEDKNIVEARKDIFIIDFRTGDTAYLQSLTWNTAERRIFSTEPVKSVNGPRVTYGDGFESDEEFKTPLIVHQRGTMTFDDE